MAQPWERQVHEVRAKRPPQTASREAPFTLVRDVDRQPDDGLTLDGWGAVFNSPTIIDSWEGRFREQIAPGSMKRSFRETPPKIQFDHGRHPLIGSLPIASLTKVEEASDPTYAPDGGAHIVGRLLDNWLVQPVRDAVAAGVVSGMSFRFEVVDERWETADGKPLRSEQDLMRELDRVFLEDLPDDELPLRTLRQLKVPEMGPVTWPAYEETSVGVRSKIIDLSRLREPGQRKLLAKAVYMADAIEARADTPGGDTDTDDDPNKLLASLDAVLDEATELVANTDATSLPAEVAQALDLLTGAEALVDQLMDLLGVYDPDDAADDEATDTSGRDGQPATSKADRHPPIREQRTTIPAGTRTGSRQHATDSAGGAPAKSLTDKQLRLRNQRDRLLTLRAIGERP